MDTSMLWAFGGLIFTILGTFIATCALIWSMRKEGREDWKSAQGIIMTIQSEMKDFHNRLCQIESEKK